MFLILIIVQAAAEIDKVVLALAHQEPTVLLDKIFVPVYIYIYLIFIKNFLKKNKIWILLLKI